MSAILATNQFRRAVAHGVAEGGSVPRAVEIAFGIGTMPPSVADEALEVELIRKPLLSAVAEGVVLRVKGTLLGTEAGNATITEVGVFAEGGILMGRRVFAPKQLEPVTRIDFDLDFQF
ncbi:MAG: hypothetical protein M0R28_23010 [Pigmentiphaga sp.]|nr:hypothetical protein [Pigmentiphaga sp.]